jgi:hypothetical protein
MRKQARPQRGAKMHKEGEEPLIMGMKQIAEATADFLGLNRSALSASSAVNSSRTFPSFLWLLVPFCGHSICCILYEDSSLRCNADLARGNHRAVRGIAHQPISGHSAFPRL